MDDREKSDGLVVPVKLPNNAQGGAAEVVEGSGPAKGNATSETRPGPRAGQGALSDLDRVRRMARTDKDARFTALLHHVNVDRLRAAYRALEPKAAPGVDGVTWEDYGVDLEENLRDLHARVHRGAYRARPSRRVFIPKPDGQLRPLGVASLEDKILQRAVVEVRTAVTRRTSSGFPTGSGLGVAHIMRWTRSRSGSSGRRAGCSTWISGTTSPALTINGWRGFWSPGSRIRGSCGLFTRGWPRGGVGKGGGLSPRKAVLND